MLLSLIRKFVIETTEMSPVGLRLHQFPYFPNKSPACEMISKTFFMCNDFQISLHAKIGQDAFKTHLRVLKVS